VASPGLSVQNLTKRFGVDANAAPAVADVSFSVAPGEFFTMLGPSGCGKTTTLRMIAGLETATSGGIILDGEDYTAIPARLRNIGMVFQSYALFPHLAVFENVAFGLRVRRVAEPQIAMRVEETLTLLGLAALARRLPAELSGGQQQRVSLARALVYRPQLLLLDEPLANLDAKLRVQMREEIRRVQRALGIMVLYVTHDQEEAMAVSDRIAVFNHGRLVQVDAPAATYARPNSIFVSDFIGHANLAAVRVEEGCALLPSGMRVQPGRRVESPPDDWPGAAAGAEGMLMIRPEHLRPTGEGAQFRGLVARVQHLGATTRYSVTADGLSRPLMMDLPRAMGLAEGEACGLGFDPADATLFTPRRRA
jgi:ABC-type Fe3+/spermidine/putrescine transport system ATPase subunit